MAMGAVLTQREWLGVGASKGSAIVRFSNVSKKYSFAVTNSPSQAPMRTTAASLCLLGDGWGSSPLLSVRDHANNAHDAQKQELLRRGGRGRALEEDGGWWWDFSTWKILPLPLLTLCRRQSCGWSDKRTMPRQEGSMWCGAGGEGAEADAEACLFCFSFSQLCRFWPCWWMITTVGAPFKKTIEMHHPTVWCEAQVSNAP